MNKHKSGAAVKILLLTALLCLSFSACVKSGGKANYSVNESSKTDISKSKTSMFYGSYMYDLHFKAIAVEDSDGIRVVIMSDLGVKLQDMKIQKDGSTNVSFAISYMPKLAVEQFADFFNEFFIADEKEHIKNINGRIYYFDNNEPVLWVTRI